jgi:hypothetical protein
VAGWAAKVSVWAENAYAPIVATGFPIREALLALRYNAQIADHRWQGKRKPFLKMKQTEMCLGAEK